jgi:lipopolysaccharide biosynthesis glycosyltransferase
MSVNNREIKRVHTDKMCIVFAVDDNYVQHLLIALESFCEFHDTSKYRAEVLYVRLSKRSIEDLNAFMYRTGLEIDAVSAVNPFESFHAGYHFNPTIFLRLLAPNLIHGARRLVYVDADVIFQGSIKELFDIDLRDAEIAAVERSFAAVPTHMTRWCSKYFASGLLVMNVAKLLEANFASKCIAWLQSNYYEMPDQDAFNAVAETIAELPMYFSVETEVMRAVEDGKHPEISKNAVAIWQYSTGDKPWNIRSRSPKRALYWKYRRLYASHLPLHRRIRLHFPDGILRYFVSVLDRVKEIRKKK